MALSLCVRVCGCGCPIGSTGYHQIRREGAGERVVNVQKSWIIVFALPYKRRHRCRSQSSVWARTHPVDCVAICPSWANDYERRPWRLRVESSAASTSAAAASSAAALLLLQLFLLCFRCAACCCCAAWALLYFGRCFMFLFTFYLFKFSMIVIWKMLLHFCSFSGLLRGNCVTFNYLRIYRTGNWMKIEISSPFTKTNKKMAKNNNNNTRSRT